MTGSSGVAPIQHTLHDLFRVFIASLDERVADQRIDCVLSRRLLLTCREVIHAVADRYGLRSDLAAVTRILNV